MRVGDPKQARILSVVAVGAVAFVIIQLLPGGGSTVGKVSQQIQDRLQGRQDENEEASVGTRKYPAMLARNVFDHPYLSKSKPDSNDSADVAESGESVDRGSKPSESRQDRDDASGVLPPALPGLPPFDTVPSDQGKATVATKTAGEAVKPTIITIDGVILRPSPTALISIDSQSMTPAVGDMVAKGYRLQKITEDGVILSRKGKQKTVPVGGSLTL